MYLTTQKSKPKTFKPVPPGTHLGRLYRIVDLGTQLGEWQGQITSKPKIILYFELFGEDEQGIPLINENGKPLIITKYYNPSLYKEAPFRKNLQSWLNINFDEVEGFNIEDLLGKYAMVSVSNTKGKNGELKSSLNGLSAVPAMLAKHGMPEGVNPIFMFSLKKFDSDKYASLSEAMRKMISMSPEYRDLMQQNQEPQQQTKQVDDFNDPIPF